MKIALVTGASGGLGWELCIQLENQIDLFILCGSQNSNERLKELKSLLK
jgi:NAD(P)-dependent dehydrogenase (short-subunit alcohol dehydrogenase family)